MMSPLFLMLLPAIGLIPRLWMERRARLLVLQYPDAEQTSVYQPLRSVWAGGKRREMDLRIAEMRANGWTFLRAVEASPWRTFREWGGGLTLQFIRVPHTDSEATIPA
jgi:hypothetical protein